MIGWSTEIPIVLSIKISIETHDTRCFFFIEKEEIPKHFGSDRLVVVT